MSLLGLMRHMAEAERTQFRRRFAGLDVPKLYQSGEEPPVRLALAVADISHMTAHRGAFWDVLFQRQIRALVDNGAFGS